MAPVPCRILLAFLDNPGVRFRLPPIQHIVANPIFKVVYHQVLPPVLTPLVDARLPVLLPVMLSTASANFIKKSRKREAWSEKFQGLKVKYTILLRSSCSSIILIKDVFPEPHLPSTPMTKLSLPLKAEIIAATLVASGNRLSWSSSLVSIG
jgi:hypothetical protein